MEQRGALTPPLLYGKGRLQVRAYARFFREQLARPCARR